MKKLLTTTVTTAALTLFGVACGQIDDHDRQVVYDERDDVVLVLHVDATVVEEDAVQLAKLIQLVDMRYALPGDEDIRDRLDPNGPLWVGYEPGLIGFMPVTPPRTNADYKALQELVRKYPMLEIVARQLRL